ncbi:N-acetylmuramic acid 6-phosphate etherase [Metabacillus herbersteinensis]|uniref:N-acetylmuramic acid 6-phosphate etherase n=1 Tax=Metabacillus herbersteinensis TaxID=283816 RepID=A0ABV6GHZ1_9BACI
MNIKQLKTEQRNLKTMDIDLLTSEQIVTLINQEDTLVPNAIAKVIPSIAKVVDLIVDRIKNGGRLVYVGAGTSGRIGSLDSSECPPTFGIDPSLVVSVIAGGNQAIFDAAEDVEDNSELGIRDLQALSLNSKDILIGIAASGRTPYTIGALEYGNKVGAITVALVCSDASKMEQIAKHTIAPIVGPEVITGSTRMKAGTAQKLVLNTLSTAAMIKLGKVYSNLMVDVQTSNEKLQKRALNNIVMATGASEEAALQALNVQKGETKAAILQLLTDVDPQEVKRLLAAHNGSIRDAIQSTFKNRKHDEV